MAGWTPLALFRARNTLRHRLMHSALFAFNRILDFSEKEERFRTGSHRMQGRLSLYGASLRHIPRNTSLRFCPPRCQQTCYLLTWAIEGTSCYLNSFGHARLLAAQALEIEICLALCLVDDHGRKVAEFPALELGNRARKGRFFFGRQVLKDHHLERSGVDSVPAQKLGDL